MGIMVFFKHADINQGLAEYRSIPGAVLLDVRSPQEYKNGHVPGSINLPLQTIDKAAALAGSTDAPIFVYCHSGARSRQAASLLEHMGYSNVKNIGGITAYRGEIKV